MRKTQCKFCGKSFKGIMGLTSHMRAHGHVGRDEVCKALGITLDDWYAVHEADIKSKKPAINHYIPKPKQDNFLASREWKELRYKILKKYGAKCMLCGATPADGVRIHVDHIKPRIKFPELELDENNLQVLCADCNCGKSYKDETDWR